MLRWTRVGGLAGIAFFLLMMGRVILSPEAGNPDDATGVIAAKIAAHADGVLVDQWAGNAAVLLLLVFAVALCERLRRAGADRELVSRGMLELDGGPTVLALLAFVLWTAVAGGRMVRGAGRAPAPVVVPA